jgi:phosphoglycerate dehydrogenase-like enzyme
MIHTLSSGMDHLVDHPIIKETNIPFTNGSGIHGPPMADYTIVYNHGLDCDGSKIPHIPEIRGAHRSDSRNEYMHGTHDQAGKKVGILGYGSIGRHSVLSICSLSN